MKPAEIPSDDLWLFNEGTHSRLHDVLGAHLLPDGDGARFAVWAPNAATVSVVGDFNGWDASSHPLTAQGDSGVWTGVTADAAEGHRYKFHIESTVGGYVVDKADPFATWAEQAPRTASVLQGLDHEWHDGTWMAERAARNRHDAPMSIYEMHVGSWRHAPGEHRSLNYRELAEPLATYLTDMNFTHVELLPIMEHPFYGSWGYQTLGYFAPTSRFGTPQDFMYLVDHLHQQGIGVLLDWVPSHFPTDEHGLGFFDGTHLYEHADPRQGFHPEWNSSIFNYGRPEVRSFLVSSGLFWLDKYHLDGLRVDAVASMLYLDYSRQPGEWLRNAHGGRENLEAITFLQQFNETIRHEEPGCITVAEESTAWPSVTKPVSEGGLGFTFKWNMGWMHDSLLYFSKDPVYRRHHHDLLTFAMIYEYSERFIMPLSHDEVVHLKGSLFSKMPGDEWQRLANLRLLLAYMFTRPGKKLLFMGTELASWSEWNHDLSLDWHVRDDPRRAAFQAYVARLAHVYREHPAFWRDDSSWEGFSWIDVADRENSVISYSRCSGDDSAVVILNLTPMPRERYRIGVPRWGSYTKLLSSDDAEWGGSGFGAVDSVSAEATPFHGYQQSVELPLPPLGGVVLISRG